MGAWIETYISMNVFDILKSHPTWVRGLKLSTQFQQLRDFASHPTWVRGLKHIVRYVLSFYIWSHPTWVRGLKHELLNTAIDG